MKYIQAFNMYSFQFIPHR